MKARNRILLLASLLLIVSVGGIGNLMWQLPHVEPTQDLKTVLHFLIFLGLFGAGLIFSVLELVRHEIMSPIFQLASQVARLKEREIDGHRLELTGSKDIDLLTRALNDLLDDFQKKEDFYHILVEASPDMICLLDRDGRVLFGNLNAARQWNYQSKEIIGKRQEELFPPDIAERHKQVIQKIFETGLPVFVDVHEKIGERQCWVDARMMPVLNEDGHVTAVLVISRDITKRKKAEEALRESEEIFSQFMNYSPIYVFFKDENIRPIRLSENYAKMLGRPIRELLGKNMDELFPSDLAKSMIADDRRILKEGKKVEVEEELNGRLYSTIKFPLHREGKPTCLAGFTIDITERKYAEKALLDSEQNYRTLFDENVNGIIAADSKTKKIIYVNKSIGRMLGYSQEELLRLGVGDIHPRDSLDKVISAFETQTRGKQVFVTLPCLRKDDTIFYADISAGMMVLNGRKCTVGFFTDATARLEFENKSTMLARAIETAHHGCLIISEDTRILFVNNYGLARLGLVLEKGNERKLADFCTDQELIKNAMETAQIAKRWVGETVFTGQDGRRFPVLISISKLEERNTLASADSILLFQDITVQKETREKLLASERLAVMGRLVADVAHELNNPLAIIIGGTQLILKQLDEKEPELQNQLERVLRNGKRCKTILTNLLGYGRTVARKSELVNIQELIHEAVDSVSFQYDMSGIETMLSCDKLCNVNVAGNRSALLSVFVNLVRNARQAMGAKGKLTINLGKQDNDSIRVEISDTGIGISKEQIENLFKPFVSGWQESEGSGLGLATSLGIIETHGGKMTAFSNGIGQGATFVVTLPYSLKEDKIFNE